MIDQPPGAQPNPDLARITLLNAIEDLKVSRVLYRIKHYASSIFHLQQSIEKGVKSYGYFFGLFDEIIAKNSKTFGHQTIEAYPISLEQFQKIVQYVKKSQNSDKNLAYVLENSSFFKEIEVNIDGALEDFKENIHTKPDPNLTNKKIINYLSLLTERQEEARKIYNKLRDRSFLERMTDHIYDESKKRSIQDLESTYRRYHLPPLRIRSLVERAFSGAKKEKMSQIPIFFFYQMYSMESLLYLGIITQPHEQLTRYPVGKTGFNPLTHYNNDHPIVKNFIQIYKFSNTGLKRLETLYDMEIPSGVSIFC